MTSLLQKRFRPFGAIVLTCFYLLGPCYLETSLQGLARIRVESPDSSQQAPYYTLILWKLLQLLPFPFNRASLVSTEC